MIKCRNYMCCMLCICIAASAVILKDIFKGSSSLCALQLVTPRFPSNSFCCSIALKNDNLLSYLAGQYFEMKSFYWLSPPFQICCTHTHTHTYMKILLLNDNQRVIISVQPAACFVYNRIKLIPATRGICSKVTFSEI